MIVPCKDCADRFPGCHAVCAAYREWSERHKAKKDIENANKKRENIADGFMVDGTIRRAKKYQGKKKAGI